MKNLLIATTALVATAGVAAADITFSGGARFGIIHTGDVAAGTGAGTAGEITAATAAVTAATATVTTDTAAVATAQAAFDAAAATNTATQALDDAITAAETTLATSTAALAVEADTLAALSGSAAVDSSTDVHNRFTVHVNGSAETDSGVEFFGYVRIRGGNTGDGATVATAIGAPRVGAKIGGLTVAVGNINGAIDASAGVYSGSVGLTGLGYSNVIVGNYDGYSSTGGGTNGVEVIYAANGLNVHLSHGATSERTALALGYTFGDWKVNLGVQDGATAAEDFTVLSADGTIGSASVGLAIADNNGVSAWRVNAGFEVGAGTNVTVFVADSDATTATDTAYGLGFTHSLGGATLAGGVVKSNTGQTKADLGVRFNF